MILWNGENCEVSKFCLRENVFPPEHMQLQLKKTWAPGVQNPENKAWCLNEIELQKEK